MNSELLKDWQDNIIICAAQMQQQQLYLENGTKFKNVYELFKMFMLNSKVLTADIYWAP